MSDWKIRRIAHPNAPKLSAEVQVFCSPGLGQTFQLTGQLRLTKEEADEFEARLTAKPQPEAPDLNPEEYQKLMEFLVEWSEQDLTALHLAEMVKNKFGASVRKRRS